MNREEISKKVQEGDERFLIWVGYILDEDEEGREIEYFGRFVKTKKQVIGITRSMIDNTSPYRIIIQDTQAFKKEPSERQTELEDFFKLSPKSESI